MKCVLGIFRKLKRARTNRTLNHFDTNVSFLVTDVIDLFMFKVNIISQ